MFTRPSKRLTREQSLRARSKRMRAMVVSVKPRASVMGGSVSGVAVEKEGAIQSEPYERAAKSLGYCMRCRVPCRPQFCHRDMGKGGGIKTDSREGWPGCDACHSLLGGHNGGERMQKDQRRCEELDLGRRTRAAVIAAGLWPARLPMWNEGVGK